MNPTGLDATPTQTEAMDAFFSQQLANHEQVALSARIDLYALLADIFRYPDAMTRLYIRKGEFKTAFLRMASALPFAFAMDDGEIRNLTYPRDLDDQAVEIEFIRLFEAGPGTPPCPLVEGIHLNKEDGRKSIFKDLILFYNHFGLSYAEGSSEDRADHLVYELEFLHYLCFLELTALQKGRDPAPLRLAQRDFLRRHPVKWIGRVAERVQEIEAGLREGVNRDVIAFYRNAILLTDRFVNCDYQYVLSQMEV